MLNVSALIFYFLENSCFIPAFRKGTIGSVFIHHYGTLNPGSQTLTNRQHIHRRIRLPRGLRPTSQAADALQGGLKCREEVGRLASPG